jgi:hypothetical protein
VQVAVVVGVAAVALELVVEAAEVRMTASVLGLAEVVLEDNLVYLHNLVGCIQLVEELVAAVECADLVDSRLMSLLQPEDILTVYADIQEK